MAFLDNTGDIILDAVLTDEGRVRLAKGDFQIKKFALGDDEINYRLFQSTNATPDLEILKLPIFEAFTNNIASLNSRLITIARQDILHLPIMKINDIINSSTNYASGEIVKNGYVVAVDLLTEDMFGNKDLKYNNDLASKGYIKGFSRAGAPFKITVDQGIDSTEIIDLDPDLKEQNCLVEMDNRFLMPLSPSGLALDKAYVDEDYMASYYTSLGDPSGIVINHPNPRYNSSQIAGQVIQGGRGIRIEFSLAASLDVSASTSLFYTLGSDVTQWFTINGSAAGNNIRSIVTTVRLTGLSTGYAIDIPVVLVKKIS